MDKLDEIMAWKRKEIADRIRPVKNRELERYAELSRKGPSFLDAITPDSHLAVISEVKRKSPSSGLINAAANAVEQARLYLNAEVDALSVLTDEAFFGGTMKDLWDINDFLSTRENPQPTLRKDFMVHPIQVLEAAEAGARAILIIVRALNDDEIKQLYETAQIAGLDSIFEIHNKKELDRAIRHKPLIIGVNNRNLATFETDIGISEELIPQIPEGIAAISESGIFNGDDAARAREAGANAVLVGEALMRSNDLDKLVEEIQNA
jgi:indole-3-glycerol phosphate synthase